MLKGSEGYVGYRKALVDCRVIPVLGANTVMVYETLRRYVWRSPDETSPDGYRRRSEEEVRADDKAWCSGAAHLLAWNEDKWHAAHKAWGSGRVVSVANRKLIGGAVGLSLSTTNKCLKTLKSFGWVRDRQDHVHTNFVPLYDLGTWVSGEPERLYADVFLRELWDVLCDLVANSRGATAVSDLDDGLCADFVQQWMDEQKASV